MNEEDYMMQQEYHQQDQLIRQQLEESKMDKYVQKAGTISVFKGDKEGNDKRPDWSGNLKTPDGKDFQVALWISESQKGTVYLSGKVNEPYNPNGDAPSQGSASDAVPF